MYGNVRKLIWPAILALAAVVMVPAGAAEARRPAPAAHGAVANPDVALGTGWRQSGDVLVTGIGDSDGFHVYVARERNAFAWSSLATLGTPGSDLGPWTGFVCVTGTGHYAVAVYEPVLATNRPALLQAGARAAVVDLTSGAVHQVAAGVALEYFSPACGPGDRVLLTRSIGTDEQQTDVIGIDAVAGRITGTTRVQTQLTNPVPAPDGDYGVADGALVRLGPAGRLVTVARLSGRPVALHATGHAGLDLLTVQGNRSVAQRWAGGKLSRVGEAPVGRLQLFGLSGGSDLLLGDLAGTGKTRWPQLRTLSSAERVEAVSGAAHLLAIQVVPRQPTAAPLAGTVHSGGGLRVTVRATRSGWTAIQDVAADSPPRAVTARSAPPATAKAVSASDFGTRPDNYYGPSTCAVARNDVHRQALQPTVQMAEWAADQAVHGSLTVARPANYLSTGQPAYSPQGLFPPASVHGGGQIPAQILLGVFAQESNFWQASWHARPGDGGNPLIADYFGGRNEITGEIDVDVIDFPAADCGYGIGQITDGMRLDKPSPYTTRQQVAIAVDYAANIAAAYDVLVSKWNQIYDAALSVNDGSPAYIENWYLALWAYNSGFHQPGSGDWGLGWFNNPANNRYPADRQPFLRGSPSDASHPALWPYQEKVLGWIETPAQYPDYRYSQPSFGPGANGQLTLPPTYFTFCSAINQCDPGMIGSGDPCPTEDSSCWWHGYASWVSACATSCATEYLAFAPGQAEPPMQAQYPPHCTAAVPPGSIVVDDLPDSSANIRGCPPQPRRGKFSIRLAHNDTALSILAQTDLHQLGAGYLGHMWFTHTYPEDTFRHKVVGMWEPDLPGEGIYQIWVYVPDHGADLADAEYIIDHGPKAGVIVPDPPPQESCFVNQANVSDAWVSLGAYLLRPGARVMLSNLVGPDDVGVDVAYDAVAFTPAPATQPCVATG